MHLIIEKNTNIEILPEYRNKFCIFKIFKKDELVETFTFNLEYLFSLVKEGGRKKFIRFVLEQKGYENIKVVDNHLLECIKIYFHK